MSSAALGSTFGIVVSMASMLACAAESGALEAMSRAGDDACSEASARFASNVKNFEFGPGQDFGQDKFPDAVLGPPSGGGCCAGSLQVTSLGDGGFVTVEFRDNAILDLPGPDFIVFENAFRPASAPNEDVFAELGQVSVSEDGVAWFSYPCTATDYPYGTCAGWHPVLLNGNAGPIGTLEPALVGGDPFDLADVGLAKARYVKIADRSAPEGGPGTFDLDAVGLVNASCPASADR